MKVYMSRSFVILWIAQSASALGSTFTTFIISFLVYQLSDSLIFMSLTWILFTVPNIIMNLIAGPYIDKLQYKSVMIFSELMRALAISVILVFSVTGGLTIGLLFAATVVFGLAEPLFRPAGMAYVAYLLPKSKLQRGNALLEGTMQLTMMLGPALGGVLLAFLGPNFVLILITSVLTVSGGLLLFLTKIQRERSTAGERWFQMFKEGIGFYRVFPVLFWIGILMLTINFSTGAAQPMFLPYILEHIGGTELHYGIFMSLFSIGMMLGSVTAGIWQSPKNLRVVMLGSLTCSGVAMATLAFTTTIWVAWVVSAVQGFIAMLFTINNTTFYQKRVPEHLRGRVFAVRTILAQAGIPLGAGVGGLLAEAYNFTVLFIILGGLILLSTILAWSHKIFYELNKEHTMAKGVSHGD
ncbi:MFS transporter [Geomicrobium sp. JSM 1781026]|uniref:MFS transporter n=1 Tax=Geomicrobium sp. JSM 1781026 TaxID=3344580 RepID=UPI0035BEEE9E